MKFISTLLAVAALCVCTTSASFSEDEAAFQALFDKGINGVPPTVTEIDGLKIRFLKFQFDAAGRSNNVQALPTYTLPDLKVNATEAARICKAEGQRLAMIKTREQQAAIEYILATAGVPWNVWIGGACEASFGNYYYTWADGTRLSTIWNNLVNGPAVTCNSNQIGQRMFIYRPNHDLPERIYKWNVASPADTVYFICETLA